MLQDILQRGSIYSFSEQRKHPLSNHTIHTENEKNPRVRWIVKDALLPEGVHLGTCYNRETALKRVSSSDQPRTPNVLK